MSGCQSVSRRAVLVDHVELLLVHLVALAARAMADTDAVSAGELHALVVVSVLAAVAIAEREAASHGGGCVRLERRRQPCRRRHLVVLSVVVGGVVGGGF